MRDARSVIRNHLLPPFGPRALETITEQEVERALLGLVVGAVHMARGVDGLRQR